MNHMILLSEEILVVFDYCIHNRRCIEDNIWIQKCVLALIFANAFEITKHKNFTKLKDLQYIATV